MSADDLRLGDLIGHPDLGLALTAGSPSDADLRRVCGVHSIEIETPSRWLAPGWVMLTTGVRLREDAVAQRRLVAELAQTGATALGLGLGIVFDSVPKALEAEATKRALPLFTIPHPTPFREVVSYVNRSLASDAMRMVQRALSVQRYLIDALLDDEPRLALVERLSAALDASAALIDHRGGVVTSSARPIPGLGELGSLLRSAPPARQCYEHQGRSVIAAPVSQGKSGSPDWLVLALDRRGSANEFTRSATETAAALLSATNRIDDASDRERDAMCASVLEDALHGEGAECEGALTARAAAFGVDFSRPGCVVLVRSLSGTSDVQQPFVSVLKTLCNELDAPCLISSRHDTVTALVQADVQSLCHHLNEVLTDWSDLVVGIGREIVEVSQAALSAADAGLAVNLLEHRSDKRLMQFDELDLGTLLIAEAPLNRIGSKATELLTALKEQPAAHEAVAAFFRHDFNIKAAAQELCLHPNSLRYRLARVEERLGISLKDPAAITSLHVALALDQHEPAPDRASAQRPTAPR